jgi:hypothetical protein
MSLSLLRRTRSRLAIAATGAGVLALAIGSSQGAAVPAATGQTALSYADSQRLIDGYFPREAAPQLSQGDAVALASTPSYADPVAFDRKALRQAKAAGVVHKKAWRQVGPTGHIINSPNYAVDGGRLPTTGIDLALAADPRDKTGGTVYAGTGGGLFRTSNGGSTWHRAAAIPAVPVSAVAVDPRHPSKVYAVTGQGFQGGGEYAGLGAYWSHDSGQTWHAARSSVHGAGQQVAVGPDGAVYAATTGGLFRSTDGGRTYKNVLLPTNPATGKPAKGTPVGSWTSDVTIRPGSGNNAYQVYAAVGYVAGNVTITNPDGSTTPAAPGNGLYISKRDGRVGTYHLDKAVYSQVSGWEQPYGHISSDPIGRTRLTWSPDGKYLFALVADAGHRSGGFFGPLDPADPLGIPHPTSLNGIYRSADGGQTWDEVADSDSLAPSPGSTQAFLSAFNLLGYNPGIQAWYNGWIAFDPTTKRLLVGEEEVYQSQLDATATAIGPGGGFKPLTFDAIDAYVSACDILTTGLTPPGPCPGPDSAYSGQVTHPDQHGVSVINLGGGKSRIWIGNDGGVFRQDHASGGAFKNGAWTSAAHLNELLPYRAVMGPNGEVIAGLQDNGSVLWPRGSNNSYEVCDGDGTWVGVDRKNPKVFYCNANGDTYVTTDGGHTTTDITPCPASGDCGNPTFEPAATAMDPFNSNHIALATTVVYSTTKGPATSGGNGVTGSGDWKNVFSLGTTKDGVSRLAEALDVQGKFAYVAGCGACQSSVKLPIKATDRMLATNVKPGCHAAAGSSSCWHVARLKGMPNRQIMAVAADPRDVQRVYLATGVPSVIRVDFGGAAAPRVLMSNDGGNHVVDVSGNLPRGNVWDIKVAAGNVYAATDYGVFIAKVGSTNWHRLGTRLPITRVFGLNFSANRSKLVASTYGAGVWVFPLRDAGLSTRLPSAPRLGEK